MRKIVVSIELENAAFEGENESTEVARILRRVADDVERGGPAACFVRDVNGNRCGEVRMTHGRSGRSVMPPPKWHGDRMD